MNLDELRSAVDAGEIDTVLLALVDMQGRLQGKRLTATHFLNEVVPNNAEGCNYLLAVDVEMNTVEGYTMSSWERGYGDFVMVPDLDTLRPLPWWPGSVMCLADVRWEGGSCHVHISLAGQDGTPLFASDDALFDAFLAGLIERLRETTLFLAPNVN